MSIEVKTTGMIVVIFLSWSRCSPVCSSRDLLMQLGVALTVALVLVVAVLDVWVYRPVNSLIRRSRRRLGSRYEHDDPRHRDEIVELDFLINTHHPHVHRGAKPRGAHRTRRKRPHPPADLQPPARRGRRHRPGDQRRPALPRDGRAHPGARQELPAGRLRGAHLARAQHASLRRRGGARRTGAVDRRRLLPVHAPTARCARRSTTTPWCARPTTPARCSRRP